MKREITNFNYGLDNPNKFDKLRYDWIVGVIKRDDTVISQQHYFADAPTHEDIYPLIHEKRWRWDFDKGVSKSVYGDTFDVGDFDLIRYHLKREYGIKFYENGFHDIQYFISRMSKNKK